MSHGHSFWGLPLAALSMSSVLQLRGSTAPARSSCTLDSATGTTIDAQPFLRKAMGSRWSFAADKVAFSEPDAKNRYHLFTIRPDERDRRALAPDLPGHQGAPYWDPSGRFILFTSQKPDWSGRTIFGIPDYEALPGFGRHSDLWIASVDSGRLWRLTHEPNTHDQGVLIPVFSPDGKRVAWSARQPGGSYVLKVADFVRDPQPHLDNTQSYQPGGLAYYETGSFTSDGKNLIYTSDQDTRSFWRSQIYSLELRTGKSARLTSGNDYNEHPTVVKTPTGDWIVFMSTKGVDRRPLHILLGADWYAVKSSGGEAKRLTTMNLNRPDNAENTGRVQVAGTVTVSPSGEMMLGDVQDNIAKQTGNVMTVRFTCR